MFYWLMGGGCSALGAALALNIRGSTRRYIENLDRGRSRWFIAERWRAPLVRAFGVFSLALGILFLVAAAGGAR